MDKLDIILEQLQEMKSDIKELKTGQKKIQKDITDIPKYLQVGLEEDNKRLKNRVAELEKKVM